MNLLKHLFQSTAPQGSDATKVRKNDWNEGHKFDGGSNGHALVRDTSDASYGARWANRRIIIPLGGSRQTSLPLVGSVQSAVDYLDVEIDGDEFAGLTATLRTEVRTENAGTSITPRLFNVTDNASAGTGVASTGTQADYSGTNQKQSVAVTLASGQKKYRLQGTPQNATDATYVIGYLEIGG